jgi:HSP20 family protein
MMFGDPRLWMWNEALALITRAEQLHRRFFEPGNPMQVASWEPPVDMFETDQDLWILLALPGVEHGDLDVSVDANVLRVSGQRRLPSVVRTASIHRLEIPYGRFERRIKLPSTPFVLGRSDLVNGCLVVGLAKRN